MKPGRWTIEDIDCTFPDNIRQGSCVKSTKQHSGGAGQPRAIRRSAEGTVRIGATAALPSVLRRLGADPARLMAEVGFDLALFDDPDNEVSFAARNRLLSHCVASTGCRHLGILVGAEAGLHSLGIVGLLAKYSPDVETALRSLVRYLHHHVRGAVTTLAVDDGLATLGYEIYQPHTEAIDQVGSGANAIMVNIMRDLCGSSWKPVEVRFGHRKPDDVGPYRRFFKAPLRFDAEQNALVFSADWLSHSPRSADPEVRRLLQRQIDALEVRHGADFPEQVRSVLRTALVTGQSRADRVAAMFSMHPRTLSRRLDAFGVSFQALVDECRFEISRQMLEDSEMDVSEIAVVLDYADPSAFTRAFRRWSGTTPGRWRASAATRSQPNSIPVK
jgi:AraC-like DNA-binding protein